MVERILFQNYKAFEQGEIKLKPITILLGANSVGKSSIINLLLMLQQTANSTKYKSVLRLHGENLSMGECENIFRNKDTEKNIILGFEFSSDILGKFLRTRLMSNFINQMFPFRFISRYSKKDTGNGFEQFINRNEIDEKVYSSKETFLKFVDTIRKKGDSDDMRYYQRQLHLNDKDALVLIYDFLVEAKKIEGNRFILSFELCHVKQKEESLLKMKKVLLTNNDKRILDIQFVQNQSKTAYESLALTSDFVIGKELVDEKVQSELIKLINYDSTIFSWIPRHDRSRDFFRDDEESTSLVTQTIAQVIEEAVGCVAKQFAKEELMNHVSPIRAHPKRYYFLDKANINTSLDSLDGNSLTEILKENEEVKKKVNKWLEKFGLQVDVATLQDVIHKLKVQQYSLKLDITDVGFGISQVLPVIVQGFLSFEDSLTMIEQPEIHLHPKMQADLADLFIDIVTDTSKQGNIFESLSKYLLIETHSEYLLRRLRRRISEGEISAQDVAIYCVYPPKDENSSAEIQEQIISEEGVFDWPQDFYADELRKDSTEFIKQIFRKK
jgi:predicted ATPase